MSRSADQQRPAFVDAAITRGDDQLAGQQELRGKAVELLAQILRAIECRHVDGNSQETPFTRLTAGSNLSPRCAIRGNFDSGHLPTSV